MPSAISIVTASFLYSAPIFLFGAYYCQPLSRMQAQKAMVRIVDKSMNGCMVWREQTVNTDRKFW
jgi:hypothetical protein